MWLKFLICLRKGFAIDVGEIGEAAAFAWTQDGHGLLGRVQHTPRC